MADFWLQEMLMPQDTLAAAGVAYHLTDLLLPELAGCVQAEGGGEAPDNHTLRLLLDPFCRALASTRDAALVYRLRCALPAGRAVLCCMGPFHAGGGMQWQQVYQRH